MSKINIGDPVFITPQAGIVRSIIKNEWKEKEVYLVGDETPHKISDLITGGQLVKIVLALGSEAKRFRKAKKQKAGKATGGN